MVAAVRGAEGMQKNPGVLTLDDLKGYRAVYRKPINITYRGYSVGGSHICSCLKVFVWVCIDNVWTGETNEMLQRAMSTMYMCYGAVLSRYAMVLSYEHVLWCSTRYRCCIVVLRSGTVS